MVGDQFIHLPRHQDLADADQLLRYTTVLIHTPTIFSPPLRNHSLTLPLLYFVLKLDFLLGIFVNFLHSIQFVYNHYFVLYYYYYCMK